MAEPNRHDQNFIDSRMNISAGPRVSLELVSNLITGKFDLQVQNLLKHVLNHDGFMSIGEHIYLKLRAGQRGSFEENIQAGIETAGALLAYLDIGPAANKLFPGEAEDPGSRLVGYAQLLAQPSGKPSRLLGEIVVHPHLRGDLVGHKVGN